MTRKKVKLAYITNDPARKATLKKRKNGLMKKLSEPNTLCNIDACAIMYDPYESQPDVWPSYAGVERVLSKFKDIPKIEQTKKKVDQEGFVSQMITKVGEKLKKSLNDNREKEMTQVMFEILIGRDRVRGMNPIDLKDLSSVINKKLKEITDMIDGVMTFDPQASSSSYMAASPPPVMTTIPEVMAPRMSTWDTVQTEVNDMDLMQQIRQWINELMNNNNPLQGHVGY